MTFLTLDKQVQLKPYLPPAPKDYTLLSDAELIAGAGGTLIVDTESFLNYFLAAFKCLKTGKYYQLEYPINPQQLSWILHSYTTVGFNSIKYDLPMLWAAYAGFDTEKLQAVSWQLINGAMIRDVKYQFNFEIFSTTHVDIIEVCPLKGSLKLYGARLHSPRIQDLPFDVTVPLEPEQIPIVKDYNINDLDETERIFTFMKDRFELRQSMSIEYRHNLMSKSDAQIAEAVINREVKKVTGEWPKKPIIQYGTKYQYNIPSYVQYKLPQLQQVLETVRTAIFEVGEYGISLPKEISGLCVKIGKSTYRMGVGGLHSYEKNVSYYASDNCAIIDRDVASYYPRIILNQGLYPAHIGLAFNKVYNAIVERRLIAKKMKNTAADKGLKVTINGTFGKSNSIHSTLYSPEIFIQVVITGQLSLLMLIEMLEENGMDVISANTDGVVFRVYKQYELDGTYDQVIRKWEILTNFQTEETRYIGYYARDVNAYFAIKPNGEVKVKGPYSEVGSATGTQLDNNPASLICSDAVKELLSKGMPIEKTIHECKDIRRFVTVRNVKGGAHKNGYYLGKTVRWAYFKNETGTINYILSGNVVPETHGARPLQDLPKEFPVDLNYDWYIRKTVEILYDIDYHKRPEQIRFF